MRLASWALVSRYLAAASLPRSVQEVCESDCTTTQRGACAGIPRAHSAGGRRSAERRSPRRRPPGCAGEDRSPVTGVRSAGHAPAPSPSPASLDEREPAEAGCLPEELCVGALLCAEETPQLLPPCEQLLPAVGGVDERNPGPGLSSTVSSTISASLTIRACPILRSPTSRRDSASRMRKYVFPSTSTRVQGVKPSPMTSAQASTRIGTKGTIPAEGRSWRVCWNRSQTTSSPGRSTM